MNAGSTAGHAGVWLPAMVGGGSYTLSRALYFSLSPSLSLFLPPSLSVFLCRSLLLSFREGRRSGDDSQRRRLSLCRALSLFRARARALSLSLVLAVSLARALSLSLALSIPRSLSPSLSRVFVFQTFRRDGCHGVT